MSIDKRRKQAHLDDWGAGVDVAGESLCPAPGCDSDAWTNQGPAGFECAECGTSIPDERVRLFDQNGGGDAS
jgi:hypothetical protein